MSDRTSLLFALPAFRVLDVLLEPDGGRRVLVESFAVEGGRPACGVLSGLIKDHRPRPGPGRRPYKGAAGAERVACAARG